MPFGSDCSERAAMRLGGCPSCGIFQTPRLPGSQDARFAYRLSCSSNVRPVRPAKKEPQKVSGGAASGSMTYVDWLPSAAILRISPVSARLTYLLLSRSIAMLSGVSSRDELKSATVSTWANAQGAAATSKKKKRGMKRANIVGIKRPTIAFLLLLSRHRLASAFVYDGRKSQEESITLLNARLE